MRQIQTDHELALAMREDVAGPGRGGLSAAAQGRLDRLMQLQVLQAAEASSPGPSRATSRRTTLRVAKAGQVIPVRAGEVRSQMCLLGYVQNGDGAWFTMAGPGPGRAGIREQSGRHVAVQQPPLAVHPSVLFRQLAAEDDAGIRYQLSFHGGSRPGRPELQGVLRLRPDPPREIRWLDLRAPGAAATRVSLDPAVPPPEISITATGKDPGDLVLDVVAARLLAVAASFPQETPEQLAATRPGLGPHPVGGLAGIITAFRAAGVLSPSSPGPAQIARLCARLGLSDEAIDAPPAGDMPVPWLSMLSRYHLRPGYQVPAAGSWASTAAQLPEVDGVRLAVLGLHHGEDGTVLHLLADGVTPEDDWAYYRAVRPLPVLWIRDSAGNWHATLTSSWSPLAAGTVILRLAVVPALEAGVSGIEVTASGRSAEVRAALPLRWS
ncbi:MAG: hypothetical protein ACRDPO_25120 [Streptosporangiaceae bacterium]